MSGSETSPDTGCFGARAVTISTTATTIAAPAPMVDQPIVSGRRRAREKPADRLVEKHGSERHRDDRIDERISRDDRNPNVLQQPGVRRECNQRPDQHEIDESDHRLRRERVCVDRPGLSFRHPRDGEEGTRGQHLH